MNNNIPNEKIQRQNKNMYNNRPLNNFNPNLIKRKGTPQLVGHTSLLDRNQPSGPVKIKNGNKYNNNYIINNNGINNHTQKKKPTTPDLNLNHRQKHDFIDINNNTNGNMNHHKYKYNGNMNINSYNFNNRANNTMPNGFGYTGGPNNYKKSNPNSLGMTRPSTAPHKDKEKLIKNSTKSSYQNNYQRMGLKHNQRPSSAGGKNKNMYGNNFNNNINNNRIGGLGLGKNLSNANMNTKNRKKKLINEINKRLSTPQINNSNSNSNMMGFNNNMNNNYGNNNNFRPKINQAKNRIPSPMIKSNNNYRRPPLPNKNRIRTNKSDKFN
jgi:hypothetical protein